MKRLAICMPQTDNVKAGYALSLARMMLRLGSVDCGVGEVVTVAGSGSILPDIRQGIAARAIAQFRATHLLWLDSDHEFPADTAHRLIAHDRPWVGINATTRKPPIRPTAIDSRERLVHTGPHDKGLERVHRMGLGVALIEARVFEAIELPWFQIEYIEGGTFRGEDVYFSEKARAAGFHPMVDHDLTKETTHIGSVHWSSAMVDAGSLEG